MGSRPVASASEPWAGSSVPKAHEPPPHIIPPPVPERSRLGLGEGALFPCGPACSSRPQTSEQKIT